MNNPVVSVIMITYGHEKYIAQAMDGVLMQQTRFPVELIIANDCSPDRTDFIVQKYISENIKRDLIRYFNHEKNLGMMPNFIFAVRKSKGKYIAMCEGDDYWTDPLKLQKQVDFLEKNTRYSMVCHDALVIDEINNSSKLYFDSLKRKQVCTTKDTLNIQFCPTGSILGRRNGFLQLIESNILVNAQAADQLLVQVISLNGLLYRMYDVMSVYRKTANGASESLKKDLVGNLKNRIDSLDYLNEISNHKYQRYIKTEKLLIRNRISILKSKSKFKTGVLRINKKALSILKKSI